MHAVKAIKQALDELKEKPHSEDAPGGATGVKGTLQKVTR
jgi:hypothetical protein